MPQIQHEGTIGVETVDTRTDLAPSLQGILEGPVERVGSGRVEEGPATAKVVAGDGPVGVGSMCHTIERTERQSYPNC
jgi:hypothetical protein